MKALLIAIFLLQPISHIAYANHSKENIENKTLIEKIRDIFIRHSIPHDGEGDS